MDMNLLAEMGARLRLEQLHSEISELMTTFPDLADLDDEPNPPPPAVQPADEEEEPAYVATAAAKPRKRQPLSPEQKKQIGKRMKKYWAERRRAEGRA